MHTVQKGLKRKILQNLIHVLIKKHLCPLFTKILVPISTTVLALTLRH